MSVPAIRCREISKKYRLGRAANQTAAERLAGLFRPRKAAPVPANGRFSDDEVWALRDISVDIAQGDVVGILGRNGAGKSTLLKILSRVTSPSSGYAEVRGRVGSLLEVGTGFNAELSGRENIFLSAAILGMRRAEIRRRFDQIVDFADIPGFLDTPVKHYSSGMYMRLAFAVAAHLDHEILLVDEVLAVGDAAFQRKCLGKLNEDTRGGRTVIFVSHSLPAVASLCTRALMMDQGRLVMDGPCQEVLAEYQRRLQSGLNGFGSFDLGQTEHYGTGRARMTALRMGVAARDGQPATLFRTGDDLTLEVDILADEAVTNANVAVIVYDTSGYRLVDANTLLRGQDLTLAPGQRATVSFRLENLLLKPGEYAIGLWIGRTNVEDMDGIAQALTFMVEPALDTIKHTAVFPGVYQCAFSTAIETSEP